MYAELSPTTLIWDLFQSLQLLEGIAESDTQPRRAEKRNVLAKVCQQW